MHTGYARGTARIIVPGLLFGGLAGSGVALGWYPHAVGIVASVVIATVVGFLVFRFRKRHRR